MRFAIIILVVDWTESIREVEFGECQPRYIIGLVSNFYQNVLSHINEAAFACNLNRKMEWCLIPIETKTLILNNISLIKPRGWYAVSLGKYYLKNQHLLRHQVHFDCKSNSLLKNVK